MLILYYTFHVKAHYLRTANRSNTDEWIILYLNVPSHERDGHQKTLSFFVTTKDEHL